MAQAKTASPLVSAVAARFRADFGESPRMFFAPGRVNLVGAHLDYNGGSVLPLAVDCGIYVAARLRLGGSRAAATDVVVGG